MAAPTTADAALAAVLAAHAAAPLRAPPPGARVHKDESVYGFDTPLSPGALYLNLTTWQVRWKRGEGRAGRARRTRGKSEWAFVATQRARVQ
jgi:hypothetical protein